MKILKRTIVSLLVPALIAALPVTAYGAVEYAKKTKIKHTVKAVGSYDNWEGVSTVSQFIGSDGEFWFAYDNNNNITVVSTSGGVVKNKLDLEKQHSLFGAVCSDSLGNLYVVTGEENDSDTADRDTIFISKYDSQGQLIATVGNNGSSSLADYYDTSFCTKTPFDAGNCDVDINDRYLAVNYGRSMYNGHQSNSVWVIDTDSMETVFPGSDGIYSSHSFGQRTVRYKGGFLFASEGDAYNRAFTISRWDLEKNSINENDIFHFWLPSDSSEDMSIVNDNFAHMGDLAVLSDGKAAFTATSAPSMTSDAKEENEQVFIQIFDPESDLSNGEGYVTTGDRNGTTGLNGNTSATDYGVKWLTEGNKFRYRNPQMVSTGSELVILYEKYSKKNKLKGVFYTILDSSGNVIADSKKFKKSASLNPCETPVYTNGYLYWVSNNSGKKGKLIIFRIGV